MSRDSYKTTCEDVEPDLVEFADSTLEESSVDRVAQHLETCVDCRQKVNELRRSLPLAQAVWVSRVKLADDDRADYAQMRRQRRARRIAASTGIAAAAGVGLAIIGLSTIGRENGAEVAVRGSQAQQLSVEPVATQFAEVERILVREEQAARLVSAISILADKPAVAEDLRRAKQYLDLHYGKTQ